MKMVFQNEQARTQMITAKERIEKVFGVPEEQIDAVFLDASRKKALGFEGLPFQAPICRYLSSDPVIGNYLKSFSTDQLIRKDGDRFIHQADGSCTELDGAVLDNVRTIYDKILKSPGTLNEKGELVLDLLAYPVGPHYPVNLLLGNRVGYPYPLYTTPKSALDGLGRGSFRGTGGEQVLATRYTLDLAENGEPANRQFYLTEGGKQIFYSADVHENVIEAKCVHSQSRTVISYRTACGLQIKRTIFILPQEDGMPNAVEAQRIEITNLSGREREIRIVLTGMFGITDPNTLTSDIVYANVVVESEVWYRNGMPAALSLHPHPAEREGEKRFALLLAEGKTMDEFATGLTDFIGTGTLAHPDMLPCLSNEYSRKNAPFFAMAKAFTLAPEKTVIVDSFAGMLETEGNADPVFDRMLEKMLLKYSDPAALKGVLDGVIDFWNRYSAFLTPESDDPEFNSYVRYNLPFQTLYQTYVSRAFAWTQKSYRETGFREIQDIYASMYYLHAMGHDDLIRELLASWTKNVFRMGYAYHNFTFRGKEPGMCSDDQLWLLQAILRYVRLTKDAGWLLTECPIAGEDASRPVWDTIMAILTYSGCISVGKHGLPLLDRADWNDTLRLDRDIPFGPEKEALYQEQIALTGEPYGTPWKNELSESVMNACLLIIAADATAELAPLIGKDEDGKWAKALADRVRSSMQENAWKNDFFARCLINDGRGHTYLGAGKDGLSADPKTDGTYFLNSYSWAILASVATEEQIAIMLDTVEKHLLTEAGLRLCTIVDFDKLKIRTGTQLYFPGDRENGGVFKHAAMMATTASLIAAKQVKDEKLAKRLRNLAYYMIDKTVPYATLKDPFTIKGNPRFCTQYNNTETGENIGPMLSGTASWLSLAVFEILGVDPEYEAVSIHPVLREGEKELSYTIKTEAYSAKVVIRAQNGAFRTGDGSVYTLDGNPCGPMIRIPADGGMHQICIEL